MRWLWSGLVVAVLATFGVLVRATPACACSCRALTPDEAVASADAVFAGTVVGIDAPVTGPIFSSADPVTVTFEVSTVYKGDVPAMVRVHTVVSEISCGYEFDEGLRYLVHVHIDQAGQWSTGLCSGNQVLADEATTQPPTGQTPTGQTPTDEAPADQAPADQAPGTELGLPSGGHPPTAVAEPPSRSAPWALFVVAKAVAIVLLLTPAVAGLVVLRSHRRRPGAPGKASGDAAGPAAS